MPNQYNEEEISEEIVEELSEESEETIEVFSEEELELPLREKSEPSNIEELPQPIYRLKTLHSSETFHAYYVPSDHMARFLRECELAELLQKNQADAQQSQSIQSTMNEHPEPSEASVQASSNAAFEDFVIPNRALVVVPTKYGKDIAIALGVVHDLSSINVDELALIERPATPEDYQLYLENLEREKEAFATCRERIAAHNLPMKLISAHYLLEDSKILFFSPRKAVSIS